MVTVPQKMVRLIIELMLDYRGFTVHMSVLVGCLLLEGRYWLGVCLYWLGVCYSRVGTGWVSATRGSVLVGCLLLEGRYWLGVCYSRVGTGWVSVCTG